MHFQNLILILQDFFSLYHVQFQPIFFKKKVLIIQNLKYEKVLKVWKY